MCRRCWSRACLRIGEVKRMIFTACFVLTQGWNDKQNLCVIVVLFPFVCLFVCDTTVWWKSHLLCHWSYWRMQAGGLSCVKHFTFLCEAITAYWNSFIFNRKGLNLSKTVQLMNFTRRFLSPFLSITLFHFLCVLRVSMFLRLGFVFSTMWYFVFLWKEVAFTARFVSLWYWMLHVSH